MKEFVEGRWFALAALALVCLCGLIWYIWPQVGMWPLLIALVPWLMRVIFRSSLFRRTSLDVALFIFMVTAVTGLWATYDQTSGWGKFWIIIAAILIYFALSGQPLANLWLIAGLLSGLGAILVIYFLLVFDWKAKPADIELLTQIGLWWMEVRPTISASRLHPNIAAGMFAVFLPFTIALGVHARRKQSWTLGLYAVFTGVAFMVGLLMASSRLTWIALGISIGPWMIWEISSYLAKANARQRYIITVLGLSLGLVLMYWLVVSTPGGFIDLINQLPGPDNAASRIEVMSSTLKLVPDYAFSGGGLTAIPGLYSQYIRVVPNYTINNSNNLFLNIALEQGIFGLTCFLCILMVSFWSLITSQFDVIFRWAVLTSLIVMIITGLASDPFYGGRGTPLLLIIPGLAVALARVEGIDGNDMLRTNIVSRACVRAIILGGLALVTLLAFSIRGPLVAQWYANIGGVQMARYELAEFPADDWNKRQDLELLRPSYDYFTRSIELNPLNFTAQYRMGLIAMRGRNFDAAVSHLEVAYTLDPEHPGLQKVLGYAYVWTAQFEKALPLMIDVPLIKGELRDYRTSWQEQGRGDLSTRSDRMLELIKRLESELTP